jgi:hypothetical protein
MSKKSIPDNLGKKFLPNIAGFGLSTRAVEPEIIQSKKN